MNVNDRQGLIMPVGADTDELCARSLTNDDVIGVASLRHLLDEEVHHAPQVVVLALEQLRHAEEHLTKARHRTANR